MLAPCAETVRISARQRKHVQGADTNLHKKNPAALQVAEKDFEDGPYKHDKLNERPPVGVRVKGCVGYVGHLEAVLQLLQKRPYAAGKLCGGERAVYGLEHAVDRALGEIGDRGAGTGHRTDGGSANRAVNIHRKLKEQNRDGGKGQKCDQQPQHIHAGA